MARGNPDFAARVLACLSSGIVGIDARGKVVLINEGARRILGFPEGSAERAIGLDCRAALNAYPTMARLLLETLEGREALSRAELVLEAPGWRAGSTIGFTLSPVRDEAGDVCGATMLFRDLTPFERSDEQERLRDRLAALGEMAAGMAHEIRNPLAGMEMVTGLLQRHLADRPEENELLSELSGQMRALAETVSESLEFVRPIALTRASLDPVALVETALTRALARAPRPSEIERCYADALPPIAADADLLGAAISNLLVNACEAMAAADGRQPSRLVLELRAHTAQRPTRAVRVEDGSAAAREPDAPTRELVISISDTGPGIPLELREKIFYPFFTTKQSGSGIGLANVQKVVLAHGGSVALEVPRAGGCTFRVHIPVAEAGVDAEDEAADAETA